MPGIEGSMNSTAQVYEMPDAAIGAAVAGPSLAAPISIASKKVSRWADFYELIKPRMNLLILGTTTVGYIMAAQSRADWLRLPHALIGTAFCAAGAAILNQLVERRYDALMPRTAKRPLPTGGVSP